MRAEKLRRLKKYSKSATWAIWDSDYKEKNVQKLIENSVSQLHARVVMVGLNPTKIVVPSWGAFRVGRFDRRLAFAFKDSAYKGAYVTDILKDQYESKSAEIATAIRRGELDLTSQVRRFRREMTAVGADRQTLFVLFGSLTAKIFCCHLQAYYPYFVECQHYSYYGVSDVEWVENTWRTLEKYSQQRRTQILPLPFKRTAAMKAWLRNKKRET